MGVPGRDYYLEEASRIYFKQLCRRLYKKKHVRDLDQAQEVVQKTFIGLLKEGVDFSSKKIGGLLWKAALCNAIDDKRKGKTDKKRLDRYINESSSPTAEETENEKVKSELIKLINEEIEKLPPKRRLTIKEIFFNEKTLKELAKELGRSEYTVKANLLKSIETLAKKLKELRDKDRLP